MNFAQALRYPLDADLAASAFTLIAEGERDLAGLPRPTPVMLPEPRGKKEPRERPRRKPINPARVGG